MTLRVGWADDPELAVRALVLEDVGPGESLEIQRGMRPDPPGETSE